jgi:plastocyanin
MDGLNSTRNAGRLRRYTLACGALLLLTAAARSLGQSAEVTLHVDFAPNATAHKAPTAPSPTVVAWLTPLGVNEAVAAPLLTHTYQMAQKDKMFDPHLLAVPVGSLVVFPNRDPFFHNVFSLFNGKRFDLGLYEAGSERRVRFDREGVSYIFCNIHPEMGAVILSLATPYYTFSREGAIAIPQVPPGKYILNVWSEGATPESLNAARREVTVEAGATNLGIVSLVAAPSPIMHHANKFGEPYSAAPDSRSGGSVY